MVIFDRICLKKLPKNSQKQKIYDKIYNISKKIKKI